MIWKVPGIPLMAQHLRRRWSDYQAEIQLSHQHLNRRWRPQLPAQQRLNTYILKLLQQTYQELGDWQALTNLLPTLYKQKVLSNITAGAKVYGELFMQAQSGTTS